MTNEEVMQMMTDMGLHEGGMDNWVMDNAWYRFAKLLEERFMDRLVAHPSICRQIIDAGMLSSNPAGFKKRGEA